MSSLVPIEYSFSSAWILPFSEAHTAVDDMLNQICNWFDGREEFQQTNLPQICQEIIPPGSAGAHSRCTLKKNGAKSVDRIHQTVKCKKHELVKLRDKEPHLFYFNAVYVQYIEFYFFTLKHKFEIQVLCTPDLLAAAFLKIWSRPMWSTHDKRRH